MKACRLCAVTFDPEETSALPEVEAGLHLARREYHDEGEVCLRCLANRGRIALMYCTEMFD